MKKIVGTTLTAAVMMTGLLCSTVALSDGLHGKRYAGVSLGFLEAEGEPDDASLTSFEGRFGGYLNDHLGFEFRAGVGAAGDDVAGADVDLRYVLGAYMRLGAPVTETIFPYATVGFARADVETSVNGNEESVAETDLSYGAGVDIDLGSMGVFFEYTQIAEINDADLSGFSIGIKSTF